MYLFNVAVFMVFHVCLDCFLLIPMSPFLTHLDAICLVSYCSTLTIGILKKRYLALVGCQSLSPEAKHFMRQVVLKELMKMQVYINSSHIVNTF